MMLCMYRELMSVAVFASLLQFSTSYSFRNCIEIGSNHSIFKCYKREAHTVQEIVGDLPPSATNLSITYCSLRHLPDRSFSHLPNLITLALNNNNIQSIDKDAFANLTHLQFLNLSSNAMSYLSHSVFFDIYNLTTLLLADNNLGSLSLDLFSNMTNLQTLNLHKNNLNNFSSLVLSITNLSMLTKLDLSYNSLTSLNHSARLPRSLATLYLGNNHLRTLECRRDFLSNVKVLDFSYNKHLTTTAFHDLDLNSLSYLRLRSTSVSIINLLKSNNTKVSPWKIDFSGLGLKGPHLLDSLCEILSHSSKKHMKRMYLQSNGIRTIETTFLSKCPNIDGILDISFNDLKTTDCLKFLSGQKQLTTLKVEHNHLTKLETCNTTKHLKLRELSYRYNRILQVNADAFSHIPKLTKLQLNINIIAYLDRNALRGLKDLVMLRLDNNLLSDLYAESFKDLHSLQKLILRNNQIAVIFNNTFHSLQNLTILDLGGNKITHFDPKAFNGLFRLANLYLDRNRLKQIDSITIGRLSGTLQTLDLEANYIYFHTEHKFSPFKNLTKLTDLKLSGQLPYGISILPHAFFSGLCSLKSLYLSNNHIAYLSDDTFDDLKNLIFLSLQDSCSGVTQLKPGIFKNLRKLEMLYIDNMGIQLFSKVVFGNLTRLKELHLNRNAIQTMDVNLLENLTHLRYLDIRNLPLSCKCFNSELQNWTKNNQRVQLAFLYNLTCQDLQGSNFYNFDTKVCYLDFGIYLFIFTFFLTIILTLTPILYVKLYWTFKYGYYVFRSWFGEQWRRLQEMEEKCLYDAFISYNSADEKWVMEELIPNLESNSSLFKLCLHHRDFEPGRNIVDNIVAAVYNSRKTVCIVSQNFLRSEWCSLEIQLASYRLFQEMQDVLLLVFLESISERQLSMYHRMRKVMLKKTYLQWPGQNCTDPVKAQELFWKQLKRALRSSNRSQEEEESSESVQTAQQRDAVSKEERKYLENQSQMDEEGYYLMP